MQILRRFPFRSKIRNDHGNVAYLVAGKCVCTMHVWFKTNACVCSRYRSVSARAVGTSECWVQTWMWRLSGMGRKKITISRIGEERNRQVHIYANNSLLPVQNWYCFWWCLSVSLYVVSSKAQKLLVRIDIGYVLRWALEMTRSLTFDLVLF